MYPDISSAIAARFLFEQSQSLPADAEEVLTEIPAQDAQPAARDYDNVKVTHRRSMRLSRFFKKATA